MEIELLFPLAGLNGGRWKYTIGPTSLQAYPVPLVQTGKFKLGN